MASFFFIPFEKESNFLFVLFPDQDNSPTYIEMKVEGEIQWARKRLGRVFPRPPHLLRVTKGKWREKRGKEKPVQNVCVKVSVGDDGVY